MFEIKVSGTVCIASADARIDIHPRIPSRPVNGWRLRWETTKAQVCDLALLGAPSVRSFVRSPATKARLRR